MVECARCCACVCTCVYVLLCVDSCIFAHVCVRVFVHLCAHECACMCRLTFISARCLHVRASECAHVFQQKYSKVLCMMIT